MSDPNKIEHAGESVQSAVPSVGEQAATNQLAQPILDAPAAKPVVDEAKEKVLAAKASREMWTAILIIVGSFVFVLVAAALVLIVGHIQLF